MKKLPIIGALIAAVAAFFALKKRKPGDAETDVQTSTDDTNPTA